MTWWALHRISCLVWLEEQTRPKSLCREERRSDLACFDRKSGLHLGSCGGFRLPSGAFLPTGGEFRVHSKTHSAVHGADCLLECGIERNCAFIPRREKGTSVSDEHRLQAAAEQMCRQTGARIHHQWGYSSCILQDPQLSWKSLRNKGFPMLMRTVGNPRLVKPAQRFNDISYCKTEKIYTLVYVCVSIWFTSSRHSLLLDLEVKCVTSNIYTFK